MHGLFDLVEVIVQRCAAPTTIATHAHQCGIGGHAIEPGRELRVASKGVEAANHLEQCVLNEVCAVVGGDREALKLSLDHRSVTGQQSGKSGLIALSSFFNELRIAH